MKEIICKTCKNCGEVFKCIKQFSNSKYCNNCRTTKCPNCDKRFIIKPKSKKPRKYCCKKCFSEYYSSHYPERLRKIFAEQAKRIHTGRKRPLITRIKKSLAMMGNKNHRYINGSTKHREEIYEGLLYRDWRKIVFKRDKYMCQKCGAKNGFGKKIYLELHHIKRWSLYPELRFDTNNGITLCRNCHHKESSLEGKIYCKNQYSYS